VTTRRYDLRGKWADPAGAIGFVVLLVVVLSFTIPRRGEPGREGQVWLVLGMVLLSSFGVYKTLKLPIAIETRDDGMITFESFVGQRTIAAGELESITHPTFQTGYLIFKHAHGRVRTRARFNDIHEFLSWVKQVNPTIEFRGI